MWVRRLCQIFSATEDKRRRLRGNAGDVTGGSRKTVARSAWCHSPTRRGHSEMPFSMRRCLSQMSWCDTVQCHSQCADVILKCHSPTRVCHSQMSFSNVILQRAEVCLLITNRIGWWETTKDGNPYGWHAHGRRARGQADHRGLAHMFRKEIPAPKGHGWF